MDIDEYMQSFYTFNGVKRRLLTPDKVWICMINIMSRQDDEKGIEFDLTNMKSDDKEQQF